MAKNLIKIIFLFLFLTTFNLSAQWSILRTEADSLIKVGSDHIYNVEFDSAYTCFKEVIRMYPEHPAGYFLDAMVEWWKIILYRETRIYDGIFLSKIQKVIDICDKGLDSNSYDITFLFFKAGAMGYRGRFYAIREMWLKAANDGKDGFDLFIKCLNLAPNNHDIMLGTGIFNYFAAALPEKYPILTTLAPFLPKGDKQLAIAQLKSSARYARYTQVEAKVVLLQIFYDFEDNFKEALPIAEELNSKYPKNPFFQRYLGRCYVTQGYLDKSEIVWREAIKLYIRKEYGYDRLMAREALYYVGMSLFYKDEYTMAIKYFEKCLEATGYVDKEQTGFLVQATLYLGKLNDLTAQRQKAISFYKKVLDYKDNQHSHLEAHEYIKKPFKR